MTPTAPSFSPCPPRLDAGECLDLARRIAALFRARKALGQDYPNELACEALLALAQSGADSRLADHVRWMATRSGLRPGEAIPWQRQQFHNLGYPYFAFGGQLEEHRESWLEETRRWVADAPRSASGALVHHCLHEPAGTLIDMVQAYLIRLVRASALTGDSSWAQTGMAEMERYRAELRDEKTGCYHQGSGWLPGGVRSPGCWSRGQGWVLHGFAISLPLLPAGSDLRARLSEMFLELIEAVLPLQRADGLWNQLIDDPANTVADTSGSAFIYEALEVGLREGVLPDRNPHYRQAAERAWSGLQASVDPFGLVRNVTMGPGPIWEISPWEKTPGLTGDMHGVFTMLFACAARIQSAGPAGGQP